MQPYYERSGIRLYHGDAADVLPTLEAESISAVVSDPPAGIAFMSKSWDRDKGGRDQWVAWLASILSECNRAMKPGAHAVIWALPRTSGWTHRAIEDAGLDVRDCVTHLFGSGFPKGSRVNRDPRFCQCGEPARSGENSSHEQPQGDHIDTAAASVDDVHSSPDVRRNGFPCCLVCGKPIADGWNVALKPAAEFWYLARKPLSGTVAANVLAHGTGALNIDGCRIGTEERETWGSGSENYKVSKPKPWRETKHMVTGRWPANVILDETAAAQLDQMSGERPSRPGRTKPTGKTVGYQGGWGAHDSSGTYPGDTGGASRFFPLLPIDDPDTLRYLYTPKASRRERNAGLDGLPERDSMKWSGGSEKMQGLAGKYPDGSSRPPQHQQNSHPTVKPLALMRWLLTLVTPPGGTVLDPFAGSGTTGVAAAALGIPCVLIEQEAEYLPIIAGRIDHALDARAGAELPLFAGVAD